MPGKNDRDALPAPTNVRVVAATPTSVSLAWDPAQDSPGVAGYYVYVDEVRAEISGSEYTGSVLPVEVSRAQYTALGLSCGRSMGVWIVAFDRKANRSPAARATVSTAACLDTQAPTAPTGFHQSATSESAVMLEWKASSDDVGVVGYGVYRHQLLVQSPSEPAATVSGLVCGSWVEFQVDALDAAGNRSERRSAWVQTARCPEPPAPPKPLDPAPPAPPTLPAPPSDPTVPAPSPADPIAPPPTLPVPPSPPSIDALAADSTPPSQPASLAISAATRTSVTLSWSAASDNLGVAGYDVYRNGTKMGTVASTSFTHSALTCGTSFWSGVEAFDSAGNRSPRVRVNPTTSACPLPPSNLAVSGATTSSVSLSWSPSIDKLGIAGYDVYRNGTKMASVTSTSSNQGGLACGTSYWFGVEALDSSGNRSARVRVNPKTPECPRQPAPPTIPPPSPPDSPTDKTPPTEPENLAVSAATQTSVSLTWSPSTDNVDVSGYRVYVNGAPAANSTVPAALLSALTCGTAFTFEVDAADAAGNRSSRARITASTAACGDTQPPTAPTNVSAASRSATSIALTWSASSDNVGVTGYGLYRGGSLLGSVSTTTGIFSGLTCNTNYTLAVDALDAAANRSQKTTVMVSTTACADTSAPSAPTGLAASNVTQTGLTLSWNASADNVGVTGYDVYKNGTKIATLTTRSSTQTGLTCGTSYWFGVEALDAAGNRSARTQINPSTSACSTPPPSPPPAPTGPVTITQGGTYSGNWSATGSTPAVTVNTTAPVTIRDSVVSNPDTAYLIRLEPGAQVTIERVTGNGGEGRFVWGNRVKSAVIRNCTMNGTSGIYFHEETAPASIVVTRNKGRNVQTPSGDPHASWIQFDKVNGTMETSWNELINVFGQSESSGDMISIFESSSGRIHNNYVQGAYPRTADGAHSGSGIMFQGGSDWEIDSNQVVSTTNGGIAFWNGLNGRIHDNRVLTSGKLPDGTPLPATNVGVYIYTEATGTREAYDNDVGWQKPSGVRNDTWLPGCSGRCSNRAISGPITTATEQAEFQRWLNKVAANGITVGA